MDFQKERKKKKKYFKNLKTSWVCGHQQTKIIAGITSTLKFLVKEKKGGCVEPKQVLCFSYLLCEVIFKNQCLLNLFFVALNRFSGISLGINTLTTLKIQNFPLEQSLNRLPLRKQTRHILPAVSYSFNKNFLIK